MRVRPCIAGPLAGKGRTALFVSEWNLSRNLYSEAFEPDYLARMVGQQVYGSQPEVGQNLCAKAAFVLDWRVAFCRHEYRLAGAV